MQKKSKVYDGKGFFGVPKMAIGTPVKALTRIQVEIESRSVMKMSNILFKLGTKLIIARLTRDLSICINIAFPILSCWKMSQSQLKMSQFAVIAQFRRQCCNTE